MKKLLLPLLPLLMLLTPANAGASVAVLLDAPNQTGAPGETLTFTGVITNLDLLNPVYLNSFDLNLAGIDFVTDGFSAFFDPSFPISLPGGGSSSDITLFTVALNNPLVGPPGVYVGSYALVGGADGNAQEVLGSVDFSIQTVPEPATWALFGVGALLLVASGRFRKRPAMQTSRSRNRRSSRV
jgi:hypothetical protein